MLSVFEEIEDGKIFTISGESFKEQIRKAEERGRTDAIDECIKAVRNHHPDIVKMLEQIKEQKNE